MSRNFNDANPRDLDRTELAREIARLSKFEKYKFTEAETLEFLAIFIDVMFATLTQVNGSISLDDLGKFEAWRKKEGGKVKSGNARHEQTISYSYQIRFRPAIRLKLALKERGRRLEMALNQQTKQQNPALNQSETNKT